MPTLSDDAKQAKKLADRDARLCAGTYTEDDLTWVIADILNCHGHYTKDSHHLDKHVLCSRAVAQAVMSIIAKNDLDVGGARATQCLPDPSKSI